MAERQETRTTSFLESPSSALPSKRLAVVGGEEGSTTFTFYDRLEIGRYEKGLEAVGKLQIKDPTVSSRHCVISQEPDGRCYVRDVSRNGTRLQGRRLSPNLKTEIKIGFVLSVGTDLSFRLEGDSPRDTLEEPGSDRGTVAISSTANVTVLVGDIRDYTVLAQRSDSSGVQASVSRVFSFLEEGIAALGGTLKEFQGDAIFAFWEEGPSGNHAEKACKAALSMDRVSRELAADSAVWQVEDFPLKIDWALASGLVAISSHGSGNALGLSMVGEPVVLAFRIEKFANDETGTIVACPTTRDMARSAFEFRDLGERQAKGFEEPQQLFALAVKRTAKS